VINAPRKVGKGGAVILGVKEAAGEWIGFVDADGATSAEEFFRLFGVAQQSDGVIASRWMKGAEVTVPQKTMRLLSSRVFNLLTRALLGLKYKDTQCGAKIFRAEAWRAILPNIGITRFAFDADVLFQLKRHGFYIREEPTVWRDIEGSKVRYLNSSFDMFCAIVRMRLLYSPFRFVVKLYDRLLSRIVEYLRGDELFCHAMLLFLASMVAHVCNVGFQMVVGRTLSSADYALLAAFLSLFTIVARPLSTLATAIIHYTSLLIQEGRPGAIKRLLRKWSLLTGVPAIVESFLCILFAEQIAAYFNLARVAPVIVSAVALPVLFMNPVLGGALRGMQRFGWISAMSIINAVGRVVLGSIFVLLIHPACGWALLGHVGGMYLVLIASTLILIKLIAKLPADDQPLPSFRLYLFQCFFIQLGTALLMTGDVVLVKHYLPAEKGFAYAATLSRMVVFLSVAVTAAMFPKVSSNRTFTREHRGIYIRALIYTAGFTSVSLLACFFFPAFLFRFLFKISDPGADLLSMVRWMSVVMMFATLLSINISLLLAQRRFKPASIAIGAALLYLVGTGLMHSSALQIVYIACAANLLALTVTTIAILGRKTETAIYSSEDVL